MSKRNMVRFDSTRVKADAVAHNVTLGDLSCMIGKSHSYISNTKYSDERMDERQLRKIAEIMGRRIQWYRLYDHPNNVQEFENWCKGINKHIGHKAARAYYEYYAKRGWKRDNGEYFSWKHDLITDFYKEYKDKIMEEYEKNHAESKKTPIEHSSIGLTENGRNMLFGWYEGTHGTECQSVEPEVKEDKAVKALKVMLGAIQEIIKILEE